MLARLIDAFDLFIKILACAACGALLLAVTLGVASRAVNDPLIWTDEASRFLMIYVATLGWILASRKQLHIRVRFFRDMLPQRLKAFAEAIMQAAVVLFGLLLVFYGIELTHRNGDVEATTIPISMSWVYLPIVLGGAVTAAQGVAECLAATREAFASRARKIDAAP